MGVPLIVGKSERETPLRNASTTPTRKRKIWSIAAGFFDTRAVSDDTLHLQHLNDDVVVSSLVLVILHMINTFLDEQALQYHITMKESDYKLMLNITAFKSHLNATIKMTFL